MTILQEAAKQKWQKNMREYFFLIEIENPTEVERERLKAVIAEQGYLDGIANPVEMD